MRTRTSMSMQQPGFATGGASAAFPDISNELRRYSLSVAPGSTGMSMSEQQQQQMLQRHQQQQQQQYMMQQMQQQQSGSAAGDSSFRQDVNQAMMSAAGGVNFPMSGDMSIAQRMQGMGQMFGMMGQRGSNAPGGDPSSSTVDSRASFSGTTAGAQSAGGISQADREEELLLNLLIARRQRGQMTGDGASQSQALADELMRLRQNRAAAAAAAMGSTGTGGGAMGNVSGMSSASGMFPESIYQQQFPQVSTVSQLGSGTNVGPSGVFLDYQQLAAARSSTDPNVSAPQEVNERIDRSPNRMMDARSQEMLDLSGRGVRRGFNIDMSGMMGTQGLYGGIVVPDAMVPPKKKIKRAHKKKPADMPRRPLSAYNLFFSEERERILKEIDAKEGGESEGKEEEKTPKTEEGESEKEGNEDNEEKKPKALLRPLIPSQKKRRPHRKTHGKISFQQLARMVGERWKALDTDRRKYYQDLANEDMKRQKAAMEAYYAKQNEEKGSDEKGTGKETSPEDSGDKVKEGGVTTEV